MNVRLRRKFGACAGVVYQDSWFINQYMFEIGMITNTVDHNEQNLAFERISYFVNEVFNNSVLINQESDLIDRYLATNQRLMTLPEEPVDQIVGIMLYCKLNAIVEDRMRITHVNIQSVQGDDMEYLHNYEESLGPFVIDGWWNQSHPRCHTVSNTRASDKVITLSRLLEWSDLDLDWDKQSSTNLATVAEFPRHEDQ